MSLAEHQKLKLKVTPNPCQFPLDCGLSKCGKRSFEGCLCPDHSTPEQKELFNDFNELTKKGYPIQEAMRMVGI